MHLRTTLLVAGSALALSAPTAATACLPPFAHLLPHGGVGTYNGANIRVQHATRTNSSAVMPGENTPSSYAHG